MFYLLRNLCTLLIFLILTESVWHLLDDGGAGVLGDLGADWHLNILGGLHRNLQGNDLDCGLRVWSINHLMIVDDMSSNYTMKRMHFASHIISAEKFVASPISRLY